MLKNFRSLVRRALRLRKIYARGNRIILVRENGKIITNPICIKNLDVRISGRNNRISIHEPVREDGRLIINGSENISVAIGRNARIIYLNIGNISGTSENTVTIGENFSCNGAVLYLDNMGKNISIGDDCLFSWGIRIHSTDHHSIKDKTGRKINAPADVKIGNRVWICADVTILKGAGIPDNSVVGSCSVVTKSFDRQNVVIAGNPARIVKTDIDWSSAL